MHLSVCAPVSPLLKKPTLDRKVLKNYRLVSSLAYVSKVIKKIVADRFTCNLRENYFSEPMQSAYCQYHSTETALIGVSDGLLCALDDRKCGILVLLDLSQPHLTPLTMGECLALQALH